MSLDLSNMTTGAGMDTIAPADHLLGIVQRIVASREDACIALPGQGEIAIFPGRNEYCGQLPDMAAFCRAPAASFLISVVGETTRTESLGQAKSIKDLLWTAAFYASQGLLLEGCSKYDVVQFRHWPNLTRLPVTPNAARVCALLTRHPTTIMLVHHILGIEKKEIYQIYSAAYSAGIAHRISSSPVSESIDAVAAKVRLEPEQERGLFRSLFAKISGL